MKQREPIYEAITQKILKDSGFLSELAKELQTAKPLVKNNVDLNPNWGA